jgi:lipopolysaccharide/colanic/teichoic acid biosynthesis glycosyltransferase
MKRTEKLGLISSLIILDALTLSLALALAFYLRIASGLLPYHSSADAPAYLRLGLLFLPIWILICALLRLYDPDYLLGGPQEYGQVAKAVSFGMLAVIVLSFEQRSVLVSRGWLIVSWGLGLVLVGGARFFFRRIIFRLRRSGRFVTRTLLVGADEQARAIARQLGSPQGSGIEVVGFVDDYLPRRSRVIDDLRVLGSPTELARLVQENSIKQMIVVPGAMAWESFREVMQSTVSALEGVEIRLAPGFYDLLTSGVRVTHKAFVPLLAVERMRITGIDAALKGALDFVLGGLLLVLCAPLMALLALAIAVADGPPILERHPVHGVKGRTFHTLKFRTGLLGRERRSLAHPILTKVSSNPGHHGSRLGLFLYRTGLDKVPQLLNVLSGQMSLVGPRTISVGGEDRYGHWLPSMLTVKPGMTGPWAVASCPTLEDEIRLTMYYIRNWTIWLDLQVIFQTAVRMLWRRRGEA